MGRAIVELIPLMFGSAVVPLLIIILLFVLRSENGLVKGIALVGGQTAVRVIQGILFGLVFGASEASEGPEGSGMVKATLLTILGLLLYITAYKQWQHEDDPGAPPPKWMAMFGNMSPIKAFGMGALLVLIAAKMWVFTLGAIGVIQDAALGQTLGILAFIIYVIGAELLLLIPLIAYAVAPTQSATTLEAAGTWLERHNRMIVIGVSLIFGTLFFWKGISGFIA